jgi:LysM domain-containing protein
MTTPAQLNHQPTQHSGKVMPAEVRPAPPAALISRPSAPPAPVPPFDPSADDQRSASSARRRALTSTVGTAETVRSPAGRTGRGARLVAAATVTLAVVGGLGWIGQGAPPRVPANTVVVEVGAGETIWDVARRVAPRSDQRAVVERIRQLNQIVGSAVSPGQQIQVPDGR